MMVAGQASAVPVESGARIRGLDALRGFALLGILVANARQMFLPWDLAGFAVHSGSSGWLARLDWGFFDAIVDLKFITLFSLLFGIGFAIQSERLGPAGAERAAIQLRRLAILAAFGLLHGLLFYPADVLLPYAIGGLVLYGLRGLSTDDLYKTGFVLVASTIVWGFQVGSIGRVSPTITVLAIVALALCARWLWPRGWKLTLLAMSAVVVVAMILLLIRWDPSTWGESVASEHARARAVHAATQSSDPSGWPPEYKVRQQDDFRALLDLHSGQYGAILAYFGVVLIWRTLGLFMIGAALFRSGVITGTSVATWRRVAAIGLGIGLPASLVATLLQYREILGLSDWRWPEWLHVFSSFPLAIGLAARVMISEQLGRRRAYYAVVESAGRMPLTNYIGQSIVMSSLAEPWGLGLFGQLGGPAITALAFVVYFTLALASHVWLKRFRMGPLEWLWRCGTYGRRLPIRIGNSAGE